MQGVPPGLDKNLVLCIGLDVLLDSKGDTVALGLDDASFNVLGLKCSQIVKTVVSDTPPCTCALIEVSHLHVRAHGGAESLEEEEDAPTGSFGVPPLVVYYETMKRKLI
jgi:hypothetical protein